MICKLEIYNGELNLFPVVTNERVFAQITMGNIVKGQPGKSPIIGENDNWWVYNNETGEYEDTGKIATTSDDVVKYVEAKDEQHPNRKAIQLANGDLITGVAKKEGLGSVNIAMVNEWDVVDLGTSELPINLNTPKGVRPTVQEAGQSGEEANKIAYLSDIPEDKEPETFLISGHTFQELKEAIAAKKVILIMDATNSYQVMDYSFSGRLDNATTIDGYYVSSIRTEYGRTYFSFVTLSDNGDGTIKISRPTRDQIYIPESNIVNSLTEEETGKVLDATQGKVLKEMIDQSYNNIGFITNGGGDKFLSDDGSYKTITPTTSEVKAPILVISTEKKLASSSMTELSDYIKPEVQSGQIPIELFLNCIYCLNVGAGQTPIYTKPYTVLPNTFEQVAVIKVMVPDIVNKKFNEVTINIDQATRAITVNESVTLSDM